MNDMMLCARKVVQPHHQVSWRLVRPLGRPHLMSGLGGGDLSRNFEVTLFRNSPSQPCQVSLNHSYHQSIGNVDIMAGSHCRARAMRGRCAPLPGGDAEYLFMEALQHLHGQGPAQGSIRRVRAQLALEARLGASAEVGPCDADTHGGRPRNHDSCGVCNECVLSSRARGTGKAPLHAASTRKTSMRIPPDVV